jgi:hypothetical protein
MGKDRISNEIWKYGGEEMKRGRYVEGYGKEKAS